MKTLQVAGILDHSTVNGEGFRTTLFLSGCTHNCPGCHNPATHDPNFGESIPIEDLLIRIKKHLPLIDGVTLSGGDPFEQPEGVYTLLTALKALHVNTWVYTGYIY